MQMHLSQRPSHSQDDLTPSGGLTPSGRMQGALTLSIKPSRTWTAAVLLLSLGAAAALWAWSALQPLWPDQWRLALVALGLVALGLGLSLARQRTMVLRWDGQVWHLSHPADAAEVFNPGFLTVSLDLGSWMLVNWQAHPVDVKTFRALRLGTSARHWLPVEQRLLQADWHAWRCAVFGHVT